MDYFKIHHIAIATHDIEKVISIYKEIGYKNTPIVDDIERQVKICFLLLGAHNIELVQPLTNKSPVSRILRNNETDILYHICYQVENIEFAIELLKQKGFIQLSNVGKAPAIDNNKVVFLFDKKIGLIELVEVR